MECLNKILAIVDGSFVVLILPRVSDCSSMPTNFSAILWREQVNFNETMMSIFSSYILAETSYFFDEMMMMPVLSIAPKHLNYLVFQYFDIEFT